MGTPQPDPYADPPPPGAYEQAADWMRRVRELQVPRKDGEGLREHKKRLTRQQISDTATWMFAERGFDEVRIADVAGMVGVSEKTVYNYFPTKESLVFDREGDITEQVVSALRGRDGGTSPVQAMVDMMHAEQGRFAALPEDAVWMMRAFADLLTSTPSLVAAQRAMTKRIIAAIALTLAEEMELDPRDPEPQIVAHALMGLWETSETSFGRHVEEGLAGPALAAAVHAEVERAARVLETGLWAFNLVGQTRRTKDQLAEGARALDDARRQIAQAMRDARDAWRSAKRAHDAGQREAKQAAHEEARARRADVQAERERLRAMAAQRRHR
jgi:AcrR family transcriptional regulator